MKTSPTLPPQLRFPQPARSLAALWSDPPIAPEDTLPYLAEVRAWRERVSSHLQALEAGAGGPDLPGLPPRAQWVLREMLLLEWSPATTESAGHSPYNLAPFPERVLDPRGASSAAVLRELLGWRASLMDFLADIWDVFDEPWLSCEDCRAVERYLQPPDHGQLCSWCLSVVIPKTDHACPLLAHIRAKWPESPFNPPE